jgi:hypothetical protein
LRYLQYLARSGYHDGSLCGIADILDRGPTGRYRLGKNGCKVDSASHKCSAFVDANLVSSLKENFSNFCGVFEYKKGDQRSSLNHVCRKFNFGVCGGPEI